MEKQGSNDCSMGDKIKTKTECEEACTKLNIPSRPNAEISDRFMCFKSLWGSCEANANIGHTASLICKIDGKRT